MIDALSTAVTWFLGCLVLLYFVLWSWHLTRLLVCWWWEQEAERKWVNAAAVVWCVFAAYITWG